MQIFFHSYNHKFDDKDWTYREALHTMTQANVPLNWMRANGGRAWDGFGSAYGTLGDLRDSGRAILRVKAPRDLRMPDRDDITIQCEGDTANIGRMVLQLPQGADAKAIVKRHGSKESIIADKTLDLGDTVYYYLRADRATVVQRAIDYMKDRDVLDAYPDSDQPPYQPTTS